ncbi:endonuclease/exonuclease/phosphatase family protein [Variovorax dokdonensis]|uniref:Endonuclease/exonuclease/phosphatase family protein n=1 Tax=Variovorax dokdonensis TaxID=344883 RepID=A0ABT7N7S9_9BURK|nr:endonuclease/exonuclease/phosphatase family protein [Variovorax dokdonensis]MDM0043983.1 endonuclease/exonuclease/phosphatase family protein [Variovorax dokdonensis]
MKLVTWNTQWCRGLDGIVNPERIVEGARAMADFDVLCLQEIAQGFDDMPGHPGDQPMQLQGLLPGFAVFFGAAVDEIDAHGKRQRFGNLIATRLPVARIQHHALPWPADPDQPSMPRMCTSVTVIDPDLGAIRVMTTHLEYYSSTQRMAQAVALRELHAQACAQTLAPPRREEGDAGPFQAKLHTEQAVICGDFNMAPTDPAYAEMVEGFEPIAGTRRHLQDAWRVAHGDAPHAPTFRLFDRRYGPDPVACDFVFLSEALAPRLRRIEVDGNTQVSDHQPVAIELA